MSRALTWLFFATLSFILLLQLQGIDGPLSAVTPYGIVGYELAFTASRAQEILDIWRIAGVTEQARVSLGVDVGFLLVYPWFFVYSVRLLLRGATPTSRFERIGALLGRAVLACTLLDALENYLLWQMIERGATPAGAAGAGLAAALKFLLIIATTVWCLSALVRRFIRPSSTPSHG